MKETNGANSFLPWSVQKANTQVWSIHLAYTGFQGFTQNVLSEIIFCTEAKSGAEDTENQNTAYAVVFFFPAIKCQKWLVQLLLSAHDR